MRRTFLDANVLIAASIGKSAAAKVAFSVINDPTREFATSDYLWLETLPKPIYNGCRGQEEWLRDYFESAAVHGLSCHLGTQDAKEMAEKYGLGGVDALHVRAAIDLGAEEFVSLERGDRSPLSRVTELPVSLLKR